MVKKGAKKNSHSRVIYTLILALAIVAFWRGAWGLLDTYLLPSHPLTSYVVSLLIGIVLLYSIKHSLKPLI